MYVDRLASAVHCRRIVLDSLARLKDAGWSICVAINGAGDIQQAKVRATGSPI
ncbi:hypothetical protein ABZT06_48425 [Streptomyces sp. NPDC005483]|uniref:hypothetical protein n=1 Tax=Streptomyces sp. NPDC005483 TaxID=3154882 RepID=UPI0033AA5296